MGVRSGTSFLVRHVWRWLKACGRRRKSPRAKKQVLQKGAVPDSSLPLPISSGISRSAISDGFSALDDGQRFGPDSSGDDEYFDAEDAFWGSGSGLSEGLGSPFDRAAEESPPTLLGRLSALWELHLHRPDALEELPSSPFPPGAASLDGASARASLPQPNAKRRLFPSGTSGVAHPEDPARPLPAQPSCSVARPQAPAFQLRSRHYLRTREKQPGGGALYGLLGADLFGLDRKCHHVARHIALPRAPRLGPRARALPPGKRLPPLLVVNLQVPGYSPSLFGRTDGPGRSLVLYFALPEGWEPPATENGGGSGGEESVVGDGRGAAENGLKNNAKNAVPASGHLRPEALALAQRFFGGEPGAAPGLRDRLKLVPHVVNVDDWARRAPLSRYEHRLLQSYNDKPILSRPQHRFYAGADYFEMDIDVHSYAFVARKALHGFLGRLRHVVLDVGFVVQGNVPEELPEGLLATVRVADICWDRAHVLNLPPGAELAEDALGDDQGFQGVD